MLFTDGHLPLEVVVATIVALSVRAPTVVAQVGFFPLRQNITRCSGKLSSFNIDDQSPCDVYNQLTARCGPGGFPSIACFCNTVAYNLYSACQLCGGMNATSWSEWADTNSCNANVKPNRLPFETPDISLPKWAYNKLASNQQFDVNTTEEKSGSWPPIAIALPIIVGVCVFLICLGLFLLYRRRVLRPRQERPTFKDAHRHTPRRFFGLLPGRITVKQATVDTEWEIDRPANPNGPVGIPYYPAVEPAFTHSRDTSVSSLLPEFHSEHSRRSRGSGARSGTSKSVFHTLTSKISIGSLGRSWYTSGVGKGPEYQRVTVKPKRADSKFKIDGPDSSTTTPRAQTAFQLDSVPRSEYHPPSSLPSVIDIRRQDSLSTQSHSSTIQSGSGSGSGSGSSSSHQSHSGRPPRPPVKTMASIAEGEEVNASEEFFSARPPPSSFSLSTNDLRTPSTPYSPYSHATFHTYNTTPSAASHGLSAYPDSDVLPSQS
ncbi:hypothetical protein K474DRAFT_1329307 [Panus rudis PR-1116 ss-1]|nr:hypothetical protein K474DRAFT_1329307 [Panus rudis PR-1116 ss-1]